MDTSLLRHLPFEDYRFDNSLMDSFIERVAKDLSKKKDDLIKQKLEEKGFGHLIPGIEKRIFPKIARVVDGEWELYFADNDTDEGCFIIGFKQMQPDYNLADSRVNFTQTFQYTDKLPLASYGR